MAGSQDHNPDQYSKALFIATAINFILLIFLAYYNNPWQADEAGIFLILQALLNLLFGAALDGLFNKKPAGQTMLICGLVVLLIGFGFCAIG